MSTLFAEGWALYTQGRLEEAAACYRRIDNDDVERPKALNNLALILQTQGRLDEAIPLFEAAVAIRPDSPLLYLNLANAYQQQGKLTKALPCYFRAIRLDPAKVEAHFNLATALHQQGRFAAAEQSYRKALELAPGLTMARRRLAETLFEQGKFPEALETFEVAARELPEDAAVQFDLAKTCEVLERWDEAVAAYRRSIELAPRSTAQERLFRLLHKLERATEAADALANWLKAMPGNPVAEHMRAAYTQQDVPPAASEAHVRQTFDAFADHFDRTMARLRCRSPRLVAVAMEAAFRDKRKLRILDAGCGTGVCGPLLKRRAARLVGVDLSGAMLEKARLRNVYDELVEQNLATFLAQNPHSFDAVVAAETLIYFGWLDEVFSAADAALCPGGAFIFTLEQHADRALAADYYLNPHGRYSHSEKYVRAALRRAALGVDLFREVVLRSEGGQNVRGWLVVARTESGDT